MTPLINAEPITAAEITPEWIEMRREIIAQFGFPVRAGAGNTIEIRSLTPVEHLAEHDRLKMNPWVRLILPNEAAGFASEKDRDAVLHRLMA